jgi:3-keto-5-aminohexanoate cleavage enzyme
VAPSSDPDRFAAFQESICRRCPDIVVQPSTCGRGLAPEARGSMPHLRPGMPNLATGGVSFPPTVYENLPDFARAHARPRGKPEVEVFDLSIPTNSADLVG